MSQTDKFLRKNLIDIIAEMRRIDESMQENPPKVILINGVFPVSFRDFYGTARYKIWLQQMAIEAIDERNKSRE